MFKVTDLEQTICNPINEVTLVSSVLKNVSLVTFIADPIGSTDPDNLFKARR